MDEKIISLAYQLGKTLKAKKLTIVTAESCTGGGIAQAITEISGSSAWFERGYVTYSNDAKIQMLQVNQKSLNDFGAVSQQVAIEMIEGAILNSGSDMAISVTGIAGPNGGADEKPVGTVYIAWKLDGAEANYKLHHFSGDRKQVRQQTIICALQHCLNFL